MGTTPTHQDRVKTLLSTARQRAHTDALAELPDLRALLVSLQSLQTRMSWQAAWKAARPLLAYAVAYVIAQYASAKLAYAMSPRIAGPSPLFIHGGVAISALLLTRPGQWWRYLLLTFPLILVDAWWLGLFSAPTGWWVIVVAYLQVVIMAVVTAGLLRRFAVVPLRFATVGEVGRFLVIVALGVVPASLFSTAARSYIWSLGFWFAWRTAYLGFVLGIMTFGPAIVLWFADAPRSLTLVRHGQQKEAALLGLATAIVSVLVFGTHLQNQVLAYTLIYSLVPVLIWAAVRFGPFGLASTLAFSTAIAVTTAVNNRGPFVASAAADNVLALQLFLLCVGVPVLFLAALVQEREQADAATRASEARYRAMFHSAAIGVAVVDLNGRPLEINEYVSRMVGYTPDELRAMGLRDFTHPDDVTDNEALLRRALSGEIGSYQLEKRYLHRDGHLVWGNLSVSLVRDQDGQPAYFVVHLEDVSRRKQMEHEREEQTAQLDRIFAGIADGLVVYDEAGQVVRTNPATDRLLGLGAAPDSTVPYLAAARAPLFAPRDAQGRPLPPGEGPLARVLRGEVRDGAVEQDVRLRTPDGREVEVATSTAPLRDAEGHLLGAVSILHDQTERNRLEREREAALREAERHAEELERIFEQSAEGLTVYDAAGRLVRTNAAQRRLLGLDMAGATYGAAILAGRAVAYQPRDLDGHLLPPERSPVLCALQGEVISGAQAVDMQLRTWDGRDLVIRASAAPLRDREGRIVGAVSVVRDHTERQQLRREREEARAQAERRAEELDRVFEAMADGVAVYDQHGREIRTNTALQRLLRMDLAPPEYADLSLHERMALFAAHDEQGRPLTTDDGPLPRALRGEMATGSAIMDLRSCAFDGRELELSVSAAPLRDGAGHVTGAVALFRDQTERRRLEREREEARAEADRRAEELDRIVETMADAVFVYDAEGRTVRTNTAARQLIGMDAAPVDYAELPGPERLPLFQSRDTSGRLLEPDDLASMRALRGEVLTGAHAVDVTIRTLDGRTVDLSTSAAPLRDAGGHIMGAVAIVRDQTERNQLAREREEAEASALAAREVTEWLDTFVAIAAHDLRRPVTVNKLRLELAQQRILQAAANIRGTARQTKPFVQAITTVNAALEEAEHEMNRLWGLMQQLLDVTRARHGVLEVNRQPCDLTALLRASVEEQRLLTPDRTLTLDLPSDPDTGTLPVTVDGDADRLGQVVTNYLTNAERYSPADRPIEVTLRVVEQAADGTSGGSVCGKVARVSVRDYGSGIAPEVQERIWSRFQRAHSAREAKGGLGLGLYIARLIIELHEGEVGVESAVGTGSTFWFTVPLAPED